MKQVFIKMLKRTSRSILISAACIMLLTAAAVVWSVLSATHPAPATALNVRHAPAAHASRWGASALAIIHSRFDALCPIAAANACGMGASSCFKCHAGGRGPAISKAPWHTDHQPVNNDCAGCHHGSPWILRTSMAHDGMIADPLTEPQKTCTKCHQSGNISKLLARYTRYMKAKASAPPTK